MSSRRTLILIGALVTGAIAALLIFQYVGGIEEKAQGNAQLVSVVIATADIKKGENATDLIARGALSVGERRRVDLPANNLTRVDELKSQVSQIDISPGTVITSAMFKSDVAITDTISTALNPGMVAVTVSVDQVRSVAQMLSPGDYVNITAIGNCKMGADGKLTLSSGSGGGGEGATGGGDSVQCAAMLYQKVRILGIGKSLGSSASTPVATPGEAAPPTTAAPESDLVTFEVPPQAAQRLQMAPSLSLTLVRKDYKPTPIPVEAYLITDGANGATPYGGDPEAATTDPAQAGK